MHKDTSFSFCIPTFNRPECLEDCLAHIGALDYDIEKTETIVIDNGACDQTRSVVEKFSKNQTRYIRNEKNMGLGYSINRGFREASGAYIVSMNDDAMLPSDFAVKCEGEFAADTSIGILGVRAIEDGLLEAGEGIGRIDGAGNIIGNFGVDCRQTVDVQHVYGFCYVISRSALDTIGVCDETLLAQPYSNASRIDTDHCLAAKKAGFRVVYAPRIGVKHRALPRPDLPENTIGWHFHDTRNTFYLHLKYNGWLGQKCLSLRYFLAHNLGIRSAIIAPSIQNTKYFWGSCTGRLSAIRHYIRHRISKKPSE